MGGPEAKRRLRIAIATLGRFHVLDLARELAALGHEVHFYSYVPRRRAERFGLPTECHVALLPLLWPLVALSRFIRQRRLRDSLDRVMYAAANWAVRLRLKPCDVFIGMSGIYLEAAEYARRRFGARIVVERGSRHILSQKRILDEIRNLAPQSSIVPDWVVPRELSNYAMADLIAVPSLHALQSFIDEGVNQLKMFRNPYGVDLGMFYPDATEQNSKKLVLFVGTWSFQKGVDLLVRAMEQMAGLEGQLVHVGPPGDAPMPDVPWFTTAGTVDQQELRRWYCSARVLVLPSRQEGLALVQVQALACGCPIIVSDRSGGGDLEVYLVGRDMIDVVPAEDVDALRQAISRRLGADRAIVDAEAIYAQISASLSWSTYGKRYADRLQSLANG